MPISDREKVTEYKRSYLTIWGSKTCLGILFALWGRRQSARDENDSIKDGKELLLDSYAKIKR